MKRILRVLEESLRPRSASEKAQVPPCGKRVSAAQWNKPYLTPASIHANLFLKYG